MNLLICSAGRRNELLKDIRLSLSKGSRIIATDISPYAPALYYADKSYLVPKITDERYIDTLAEICQKENINAMITLIDPEIEILAENRCVFEKMGVTVFTPYLPTAHLCFDKYKMYLHLVRNGINTVRTFGTPEEFFEQFHNGSISFPVFVKPRTGSGSVGARRIDDISNLKAATAADQSLIIQEYMDGSDLDADVYVDAISREVVSIFAKKKLSTTIGGANKTISFHDDRLVELIKKVADSLELYGANDMDFFYRNGQYYLSEINPRFGGAYLHAYGAGIDFIKMMENNVKHTVNTPCFGNYDDGLVMMMYDSVVIKIQEELLDEEEDTCYRK